MNLTTSVRVLMLALAAAVACFGIASGAAEMTALSRPDFPKDPTKANLNLAAPVEWIGTISPLRSDFEGNQALVLALEEIQRARVDHGIRANSELARSHLKHALSLAPYDAELWLALAVLEAGQDPDGPAATEALKMSYLTAPNDARLMPLRLATVTQFDALASPDLRDLAQGDIRLMLTRQPDQAPALVSAYRQASRRGKEFLEGAIRTIDPARLRSLSG
ncbi:hypothetical protein ACVWYH_006422 [Bradyrhizobium sp. GM24.11]